MASANSIRAFFTIPLAPKTQIALESRIETIKKTISPEAIRWTLQENYHLTLHFLGQIDVTCINDLVNNVANSIAGIPSFELSLTTLHLFPSSKSPKVLALNVEAPQALNDLAQAVRQGADETGLKSQHRTFRPHVTLGRLRHGIEFLDCRIPRLNQAVEYIALLKSDTNPNGAVYTTLATLPIT